MPRKPNPAAAIKAPQSVGPSGCRERLWNGRDGFTSTVESCPANNAHAKQNEGSFPVTGTPAENCFRPPERVAMAAAAPAGFPDRPHRRRRRNRGRPGRSCLATPCPHFFSRRGAGAQRRNHLNPTTPPITAARDLGWGCACHPLLRASAPPRENRILRDLCALCERSIPSSRLGAAAASPAGKARWGHRAVAVRVWGRSYSGSALHARAPRTKPPGCPMNPPP